MTAHVDDLTAETSAPLDRLVDISLQANRTSGRTKELLLSKFEAMATYLTSQLNQVDRLFEDATQYVGNRDPAVGNAGAAIGFLKKLTPHAVGAAKGLESEDGGGEEEGWGGGGGGMGGGGGGGGGMGGGGGGGGGGMGGGGRRRDGGGGREGRGEGGRGGGREGGSEGGGREGGKEQGRERGGRDGRAGG